MYEGDKLKKASPMSFALPGSFIFHCYGYVGSDRGRPHTIITPKFAGLSDKIYSDMEAHRYKKAIEEGREEKISKFSNTYRTLAKKQG